MIVKSLSLNLLKVFLQKSPVFHSIKERRENYGKTGDSVLEYRNLPMIKQEKCIKLLQFEVMINE